MKIQTDSQLLSFTRAIASHYLFLLYCGSFITIILYCMGEIGFRGFRDSLLINLLWLIPIILSGNKSVLCSKFIGYLILIFSLPAFGYLYIYHSEFSQSLIFILLDTNPNEAGEFMEHYFSWGIVPATLLYLAIPILLGKLLRPIQISSLEKWVGILIISFVVFSPSYKKAEGNIDSFVHKLKRKLEPSSPWQLVIGYQEYQKQLSTMTKALNELKNIAPVDQFSELFADQNKNIILIIGENTNRFHMSLYGYKRKTTPMLDKRSDIKVFSNAYAPRPNTIESLQQVLSFADQDNPDLYKSRPSIIALMKQAGYQTYWISNQQTLTKRNTMLTAFSKLADKQIYLNNSREQNSYSFDEKVLPPFREALSDNHHKKFIVLHMIGTHMSYKYRYPQRFDYFKNNDDLDGILSDIAKQRINEFDNAILYHDSILDEILNITSNQKTPSLAIYLADHGDDVYDSGDRTFQGRNESKPTLPMYAIPFFIYQSNNWMPGNTEIDPNLSKNFNTNDLIHTLSDLAGFNYQGFEKSKSIVNKNFTEKEILVGNPYQKKLINLLER